MEYHAWALRTKDGRVFSGEDSFPNEELKAQASWFFFLMPGDKKAITFPVRKNEKAFMLRRVRVDGDTGEPFEWDYYVGVETNHDKRLHKISTVQGQIVKREVVTKL